MFRLGCCWALLLPFSGRHAPDDDPFLTVLVLLEALPPDARADVHVPDR